MMINSKGHVPLELGIPIYGGWPPPLKRLAGMELDEMLVDDVLAVQCETLSSLPCSKDNRRERGDC